MKTKKSTSHKPVISPWKLTYTHFNTEEEGLREALCTLGNGYIGTRGASCGAHASDIHYPGTYIAGVFNKTATPMAGRKIYNEDLVNCPNWLLTTFRTEDGDYVIPEKEAIRDFRKELDLRNGSLHRMMRIEDEEGNRTRIDEKRFVHMDDAHVVAQTYSIRPENYSEQITVRVALDGSVENLGVTRYRSLNTKHLFPVKSGACGADGMYLTVQTKPSKIVVSAAARIRIFANGVRKTIKPKEVKEKGVVAHEYTFRVQKGKTYTIEKLVAMYTSVDKGIQNPQAAAIRKVKTLRSYDALFKTHAAAWHALWDMYDIVIDGHLMSQFTMRFHTFHLLQSGSQHNRDLDIGIGARGLHGEAYRGHIFWDELFLTPFYDFHLPEVSKALLMYRYRRLPQARAYAKKDGGYKGAMFPWQSGSSGVEETQVVHLNPVNGHWGPDYSRIQRHVSFAIAFNVWEYYVRTNDVSFMRKNGAELLLSIAQFAVSLTSYSRKDKRYHTEGIMGPDEFHEMMPGSRKHGLRDNAYSNFLIVWVLMKAKAAYDLLTPAQKKKMRAKLRITEKDLEKWDDITRKMNIIINKEGIIGQYEGYFSLKELNWEAYKKKYGDIHRMDRLLKAEGKTPDHYKVAKQADTLMMFYLLPFDEIKEVFARLGYALDKNALKKNYEYYLKRTSHGSTLSRVVHCYIALLLGRTTEAWKWYTDVLTSDLLDIQGGTTKEGIHTGVMGGSIAIAQHGYAGVHLEESGVHVVPHLPKAWKKISFKLLYKGYWIEFSVSQVQASVKIIGPRGGVFPYVLTVYGKEIEAKLGRTYTVKKKK